MLIVLYSYNLEKGIFYLELFGQAMTNSCPSVDHLLKCLNSFFLVKQVVLTILHLFYQFFLPYQLKLPKQLLRIHCVHPEFCYEG